MPRSIRMAVYKAIDSYSVGERFTTQDICDAVKLSPKSVSAYIKAYPGIVNLTPPKEVAVWVRS